MVNLSILHVAILQQALHLQMPVVTVESKMLTLQTAMAAKIIKNVTEIIKKREINKMGVSTGGYGLLPFHPHAIDHCMWMGVSSCQYPRSHNKDRESGTKTPLI